MYLGKRIYRSPKINLAKPRALDFFDYRRPRGYSNSLKQYVVDSYFNASSTFSVDDFILVCDSWASKIPEILRSQIRQGVALNLATVSERM